METKTTVTATTSSTTVPYVYNSDKSIPCKVCEGKGIVYGMNGQPYLCPKCDGDKYDKDKTTYPQPYYVPIPNYPQTLPYFPYPQYPMVTFTC